MSEVMEMSAVISAFSRESPSNEAFSFLKDSFPAYNRGINGGFALCGVCWSMLTFLPSRCDSEAARAIHNADRQQRIPILPKGYLFRFPSPYFWLLIVLSVPCPSFSLFSLALFLPIFSQICPSDGL
jgi:hypothetical protein